MGSEAKDGNYNRCSNIDYIWVINLKTIQVWIYCFLFLFNIAFDLIDEYTYRSKDNLANDCNPPIYSPSTFFSLLKWLRGNFHIKIFLPDFNTYIWQIVRTFTPFKLKMLPFYWHFWILFSKYALNVMWKIEGSLRENVPLLFIYCSNNFGTPNEKDY